MATIEEFEKIDKRLQEQSKSIFSYTPPNKQYPHFLLFHLGSRGQFLVPSLYQEPILRRNQKWKPNT